jgi:antitoxin Phd
MTSLNSSWPVQDAKARFSELLDTCLRDGPQTVTRRGQVAAVLVPAAQWQRMAAAAPRSLKQLLLAGGARTDMPTPDRRLPHAHRPAPTFE